MSALPLILMLLSAAPSAADVPLALQQARQRAEELRYEEAVVEYSRYLGEPNRPLAERAQALLELGFVHLLLGDEVSARARAIEALELDATLKLPSGSPAKQVAFLETVRNEVLSRPKLEIQPSKGEDAARIRVKLTDPSGKAYEVLLRHALAPTGPYYATRMQCRNEECEGRIPPTGTTVWTAWYYLEANDAYGNTLVRSASPTAPLQISVVQPSPWYESPWVYGVGGAVIAGTAAALFFANSQTAQPTK